MTYEPADAPHSDETENSERQASSARKPKTANDKPKSKRPYSPCMFADYTSKGDLVATSIANVECALNHLGISLWYDEFRVKARIEGLKHCTVADDHGIAETWRRVNKLGYFCSKSHIAESLDAVARDDRRHPIRDWLESLRGKWDGKPRLGSLFQTYAGAKPSAYYSASGKLLLIAMVRRIYEPGAKYDHCVILHGAQGIRKSTFFKVLAGGDEYFTDSFSFDMEPKEIIEQTSGKWLIEAAESRGLGIDAKVEGNRALVTRQVDRARLAHARGVATEYPRQFVIVGTTNTKKILIDTTGNRRWDIIDVTGIDIEALQRDREQIFAETVELESTYGPLMLPESVKAEAEASQAAATIRNALHDDITTALEGRFGFISMEDLYLAAGVGNDKAHLKHNGKYAKAIDEVAIKLGWEEHRLYAKGGARPRGFKRIGPKGEGRDRDGQFIILAPSIGASEKTEAFDEQEEWRAAATPVNEDYDAPFL